MADTLTGIVLGPEDHGTPMSREEFTRARGRPGYLYELERGTVVVVNIPDLPHVLVWQFLRNQLVLLQNARPGLIYLLAGGLESKVTMPGMESERHPDITIYLAPPPVNEGQPWEYWTPDIVIEVVSPGGEKRDYETKADEYLKAGVRQYLIFDPQDRSATAMTRRTDRWHSQRFDKSAVLKIGLLGGFELKLAEVFAVLG